VGMVLKESVLFATTVRDNIAIGAAESSDVDVAAAARLADAHEFVMRLPRGYDTVVGEHGSTLTGGQRRRIAIARAAARRAPVVVLDEAMAGLDRDGEEGVSAALERLTAGCTTFVIGQDLQAALACDRAVWLFDGRIVDDGDPRRVLERQIGGLRDGS